MTRRTATSRLDRLNGQTANVTTCAWPGCDPGELEPRFRVGILCIYHADLVTDAVLQGRGHSSDPGEILVRDRAYRQQERRTAADEMRGQRPGFVYYLRVGDRIKIGYSADVKQRMRAYPPGCQLLAVEPGSPDLERQRHREFAGCLLDGREWFRPDAVLLEHIDRTARTGTDGRQFAHHYRRNRQPMRLRDSR